MIKLTGMMVSTQGKDYKCKDMWLAQKRTKRGKIMEINTCILKDDTEKRYVRIIDATNKKVSPWFEIIRS